MLWVPLEIKEFMVGYQINYIYRFTMINYTSFRAANCTLVAFYKAIAGWTISHSPKVKRCIAISLMP